MSPVALAADFRVPETENGNITINKDENVKNLYTAGATVTVNSDVAKSLHAAGGTVFINGKIGQSVYAAGGTVMLRGNVDGSAHLAGGNITIEGKVADDLIIGGGNIVISSSASIGGDLIIGGGNVTIEGPVGGNIIMGAGEATINSKVAGSVKGEFENLTLGSQAEIGKNLDYKSSKAAILNEGAKVLGETIFGQVSKNTWNAKKPGAGAIFGLLTLAFLIKLLTKIAAGLVLVYLLKKVTGPVLKEGLTNFWSSLGIGFAGFFLTPILTVILAITVVGLGVAGIVGISFGLFLVLAKTLAYVVFGSWLIKLVKKEKNFQLRWQEVVIGTIVLSVIGLIPFLGWAVVLVFMLVSLGALLQLLNKTLLSKT